MNKTMLILAITGAFLVGTSIALFTENIAFAAHTIPNISPIPPLNVNEDETIDIVVQVEDLDTLGIRFYFLLGPSNGTLSGTPPDLTYSPDENIFGSDEFVVIVQFADGAKIPDEDLLTLDPLICFCNNTSVTINIDPVNDPPIPANDVQGTGDEDSSVNITLVASDVENDPLTYTVVAQPTNGTLSGTPPDLIYSPDENFHSSDTFTFKANDGLLDSINGTAYLTITPLNDIPIANAGEDQSVDTDSVVQLNGTLSLDIDGDSISYFWIQTAGVPVTLANQTTSNPQFTAPDEEDTLTFMLTINDGITTSNPDVVNINVGIPVPDPTAPLSPTDLFTKPRDESIILTWDPPLDDGGADIEDYIIEFKRSSDDDWSTFDDGTSDSTKSTVTGLKNDRPYDFKISAVNSVGVGEKSPIITDTPSPSEETSSDSSQSSETTDTGQQETMEEPQSPTNLSAKPLSRSIVLTWVAPSDDGGASITDYIIEFKKSSGLSWSTFDDGITTSTKSTVTGLKNNLEYKFRISAVNSVGVGEKSSVISDTPSKPDETSSDSSQSSETTETTDQQEILEAQPKSEKQQEILEEAQPKSEKQQEILEEPEPVCGEGTHNENGFCVPDRTGGGCLIATATFGSELAPQVQQLREIRDSSLLQTESGSTFMSGFNEFYYSFSPTIADWERQNPVFKETVKLAITPLITSLSILNYVDIDSEAEMLGYGISLILLNVGMYFVAPAMVIIHLKKRF